MAQSKNSVSKRTLLDRSIVTILPNVDRTPSNLAGISHETERQYRLHGTSLIFDACFHILKVPQIYPTATVLFHRYFHQISLTEADVWSVAMACTLLAAKIEEVAGRVTMRQLIVAYVHMYRRRVWLITTDSDPSSLPTILKHERVANCSAASRLPLDVKIRKLQEEVPSLSMLGPVWKEWHDTVVQAESRLLRQLGFTLYWITPDQHPHRFVPYFCRELVATLETPDPDRHQEQLVQSALRYCNLSCRLDLCVRYAPEVIACAAIYLTLLDRQELIDSPWWRVFCGPQHEPDLSVIGNVIMGIADSPSNVEACVASSAYLKSLSQERSFNDPGSFVWEMLVEAQVD